MTASTATCAGCGDTKPITAFPYRVKGKQSPDAPRQNVCRACRDRHHAWRTQARIYAEQFDAGIISERRKGGRQGEPMRYRYNLKPNERRQLALSEWLQAIGVRATDRGWKLMLELEGVA